MVHRYTVPNEFLKNLITRVRNLKLKRKKLPFKDNIFLPGS